MAITTVQHIADVSFKDHFLGTNGAAPVNGKITVNHNTFDVSFDNGRVSARFASGTWFGNLFRGKTLDRLTQTLQTQYNNWIQDTTKLAAGNAKLPDDNAKLLPDENPEIPGEKANPPVGTAQLSAASSAGKAGVKDGPDVAAVKNAVDECFDLLYEGRASLDTAPLDCSKDVFKAFAMPHTKFQLSEEDQQRLEYHQDRMPPNYGKYLGRLGQIAELAAARNALADVETGTEANEILKSLGLLTHMDDNCQGMTEAEKKRYIMNVVDSMLENFLQAVSSMKDKKTGVVEFLRMLDGVCVEAKNDNIQDWVLRSMGVAGPARSEEKHDLAYSAVAEFNVLADEVKAPFRERARKECEAEVRANCEKEGVTDPEAIESRIQSKVEQILLEKDEEIAPLIRQKLETEGRLALYENLAGARRPLTQIFKKGDTWTVRTFTDEKGAPIMKPVSAYDIDRNFSKLVDMYMDDAISMGMVENTTYKTDKMEVGDRMDNHAKGVTDLASQINRGDDEGLKEFATVVKQMLHFKIDIPDEDFVAAVKSVIVEVASLKKDGNEAETQRLFDNYMNNFADGSYADQTSDIGRLANLAARRVEDLKTGMGAKSKNLDIKAAHCAQMLKMSFPDMVVDTKKAQEAIEKTLRIMIDRESQSTSCKANLLKLMYNGRVFTDRLDYDIAHRAAGKAEIDLKSKLNHLLKCVEHYGGVAPATFFHKPGEEVQA